MNDHYQTEQELFWAGQFGTEYMMRNKGEDLFASKIAFFCRALRYAHKPRNCIEFGANTGMNLKALKLLYPEQEQYAIEINNDAVAILRSFLPPDNVIHASILDYNPAQQYDLVLTAGVLIHINPDFLPQVYDALYHSTHRYLLLSEYYNPTPVQVTYRGNKERLFKRDFCGEILDQYSDLSLVDYGFIYHRDPNHPRNDANWFLLERRE
ncbi:MAG: hypothetical protein PHN75_15205 [Syntrophales bacterium]|nr:hypothetical protein [Syntrophales bacterium]